MEERFHVDDLGRGVGGGSAWGRYGGMEVLIGCTKREDGRCLECVGDSAHRMYEEKVLIGFVSRGILPVLLAVSNILAIFSSTS